MFGSTYLLFKKVEQNVWLHLSTFQKSRAKQPLRKVVPKMFGSTFSKGGKGGRIKKLNSFSLYY
jgi:hypothetical protein